VTYLQPPSVKLAVTMMDGRQLRPGSGPAMGVKEAKFEQKGDYRAQSKAKIASRKKAAEAQEKLLGWHGYDDSHKATEAGIGGVGTSAHCSWHAGHVSVAAGNPAIRITLTLGPAGDCSAVAHVHA